jgi:UDP-2-acetamido-3-amino-2,3-dideoxy-glucuronate N-acetyltransferase
MERYVDPTAALGEGTVVGRFSVIEKGARLGRDCTIGHNVVIREGTAMGDRVRVDDGAVIGKLPMKAAISATTDGAAVPPAQIGDDCLIGACAVIYAGAKLGDHVLVADLASVRENVVVGRRTIVGRGVTIENRCTIGSYCKLESECYITAYSELGDRVFVAPGVLTSNDNYIGRTEERFKHFKGVTVLRGGRIGTGAVILPGKVVGSDAVVAAGAVLTRDAPERKIVSGCPAREMKDVPEEQLLENQGWDDVDEKK